MKLVKNAFVLVILLGIIAIIDGSRLKLKSRLELNGVDTSKYETVVHKEINVDYKGVDLKKKNVIKKKDEEKSVNTDNISFIAKKEKIEQNSKTYSTLESVVYRKNTPNPQTEISTTFIQKNSQPIMSSSVVEGRNYEPVEIKSKTSSFVNNSKVEKAENFVELGSSKKLIDEDKFEKVEYKKPSFSTQEAEKKENKKLVTTNENTQFIEKVHKVDQIQQNSSESAAINIAKMTKELEEDTKNRPYLDTDREYEIFKGAIEQAIGI